MSYNASLQAKNAKLQALIDKANSLPEQNEGVVLYAKPKDINFYDWDGTCLYSYTLAEFARLTELPPAPTPPKDFLVFHSWTWTLEDIKSYGQILDVGAIYNTTDNKNHLIVEIDESMLDATIGLTSTTASFDVDWGDGTIETGASSGVTHTYAAPGVYDIRHSATLGDGSAFAINVGKVNLIEMHTKSDATISTNAFGLCARLVRATFGAGTRLYRNALENCFSLTTFIGEPHLTYSYGLLKACSALRVVCVTKGTTIRGEMFRGCSSLKRITGTTGTAEENYNFLYCYSLEELELDTNKIGLMATYACYALRSVTFTDKLTTLEAQCFQNTSILKVTLPSGVTTIKAQAFATNSLKEVHILAETPPTLDNSNAFPNSCTIYVPAASLEAYKTATNWSAHESRIVGE